MGPRNSENPADKKRREEARKIAQREQVRTAQESAADYTSDFRSAYGVPSLFTVAQRMTRL